MNGKMGITMNTIWNIFANQYLMCALSAWIIAQALKIPTYCMTEKKLDWHRFFGSGGMPSSHTASVISATILIGNNLGYDSALFAVSLVFSVVVMYDAMGVRRETGKQGKVINEILGKMLIDGKPISEEEMKELVGHSPFEVAGGALVGILVALFWLWLSAI